MRSVTWPAVLCTVVAATAAAQPTGTPRIVPLGPVTPGTSSQGLAASADGRFISGLSTSTAAEAVTRWTIGPAVPPVAESLGRPSGSSIIRPTDISDDGQRHLLFEGPIVPNTPFYWRGQTEPWQRLNFPSNWTQPSILRLTRDGQAVVGSAIVAGARQPMRWTLGNATPTLLPLPTGATEGGVSTMDASGRLYGTASTGAPQASVVRWNAGVPEILGTVPSTVAQFVALTTVNASGTMLAGTRFTTPAGGVQQFSEAALWTATSGVTLIPGLPGLINSEVTRLSDDGSLLAGRSRDANGLMFRDWIWRPGRGTIAFDAFLTEVGVDLTGWTILQGSITANGQVAFGTAITPDGSTQGFVAVIPAPGGVAVLVAALIAAARRRRLTDRA